MSIRLTSGCLCPLRPAAFVSSHRDPTLRNPARRSGVIVVEPVDALPLVARTADVTAGLHETSVTVLATIPPAPSRSGTSPSATFGRIRDLHPVARKVRRDVHRTSVTSVAPASRPARCPPPATAAPSPAGSRPPCCRRHVAVRRRAGPSDRPSPLRRSDSWLLAIARPRHAGSFKTSHSPRVLDRDRSSSSRSRSCAVPPRASTVPSPANAPVVIHTDPPAPSGSSLCPRWRGSLRPPSQAPATIRTIPPPLTSVACLRLRFLRPVHAPERRSQAVRVRKPPYPRWLPPVASPGITAPG